MSIHRTPRRARPRRFVAGLTAAALAVVGLLGAALPAAAASGPVTRPAAQTQSDWRVVTVVDETVIATGVTAWGHALSPSWVSGHSLSLQSGVAGATATILADGSIQYVPAPAWSGWDPVQILSAGVATGQVFTVIVNVANGLTNTVTNGAFSVLLSDSTDWSTGTAVPVKAISTGVWLDPALNTSRDPLELPGNNLSAGVAYVIAHATNPKAIVDYGSGGGPGALTYLLSGATSAWAGDVITYTVWDNDGGSASGTITLTLSTPPLLVADVYPPVAQVAAGSGPVVLDLLANDVLPNGASAVTVTPGAALIDATTGLPAAGLAADLTVSGTTVTFTPPPAPFDGYLQFNYTALDRAGVAIPVYQSTFPGEVRVVIGSPPITFKDQSTTREPGFPDAKVNPLSVTAGVRSVIDPLANDQITGGASDLVVSDVPAGWTVKVTADFKLAVTVPADSTGKPGFLFYQVRDAAGRWSPATGEYALIDVQMPSVWTVNPQWFTWAGTPITINPRVSNEAALAAVGATSLALTPSSVQLPGDLVDNHDGTWTLTPAAGFTGDIQLAWVASSGTEVVAHVYGTIHVTGPQVQDWAVSFPANSTGQVDNLLSGALWGSYADLVTVQDHWLTSPTDPSLVRSRDAVGVLAVDPPGGWLPTHGFIGQDVAVPVPTDLAWPDTTLKASLADPLSASTFTGDVSLSGSSMRLAATKPQTTMRTFGAVTVDGAMGPVAEVQVDVTAADAPPAAPVSTPAPPAPPAPAADPVANPDTGTVPAGGTSVTVAVTANDLLPNGLTGVKVTAAPAHGTTVVNPDRSVTYTPTRGFTGTDHYTYTLTDALGKTATAEATITVLAAPVVDPPVALPPVVLPSKQVVRTTVHVTG